MTMNIDNSQENADFIKFRTLDIPECEDIYDLFRQIGIDYSAEDGAKQVADFAKSHPWLDNMNAETTWIINQAKKEAEDK
jgi:hypothetical protein